MDESSGAGPLSERTKVNCVHCGKAMTVPDSVPAERFGCGDCLRNDIADASKKVETGKSHGKSNAWSILYSFRSTDLSDYAVATHARGIQEMIEMAKAEGVRDGLRQAEEIADKCWSDVSERGTCARICAAIRRRAIS